jgi:hypothetical protein
MSAARGAGKSAGPGLDQIFPASHNATLLT